ncbi:MAG TPA: cation diffusion facilitator family transporter [Spirochaetota bacterium]|nr:cation diffusion facilitator family transporter [Spirochaetota bacterium]HNT11393.1 cation diffusion facilitator family transporter [Spirochaetota bacterium]HNV46372.1 cation diffusion facilitator family transporter [Spirochaetota bacterium]HOS39693.1 cation diffusion facilitator family transporter [Spirochaetota bacterium]HPU89284.1 cation diffusion facilitator family transporter [Spirochaetota bacterium]
MDRTRTLKIASWTSIAGNLALAALKIVAGAVAGSAAVLADGIDSLSDVAISIITLAASLMIARPPDREHPYGHHRAETIAASILAFIIFFIGGQLVILTVERLLYHEPATLPEPLALYATVISIAGKAALAASQFYWGKRSQSRMLMANGQNMLNDIITSAGVLAGLAIGYYWRIPIIDRIIAIAIGVWIMISAARIFRGLAVELMDGHEQDGPYRAIFDAVREVTGAVNPHRARIRRLGALYVIDLDIEVDGAMSVSEAHGIASAIEECIKERLDNVFDIVIHVEPLGNREADEAYGLSANDVQE